MKKRINLMHFSSQCILFIQCDSWETSLSTCARQKKSSTFILFRIQEKGLPSTWGIWWPTAGERHWSLSRSTSWCVPSGDSTELEDKTEKLFQKLNKYTFNHLKDSKKVNTLAIDTYKFIYLYFNFLVAREKGLSFLATFIYIY